MDSRETIILVEGRKVVIQATFSEGFWWADFALAESLAAFVSCDREGESPWFEMANWSAPRAALAAIWKTLRTLTDSEPLAFEASDDARASVYLRLLKRCGVLAVAQIRGVDDTVVFIT